jgi:hypothetical protein
VNPYLLEAQLRVVAAGFGEECGAFGLGQFERAVEA